MICDLRKDEHLIDISDYVGDLASRLFQVYCLHCLLISGFTFNFFSSPAITLNTSEMFVSELEMNSSTTPLTKAKLVDHSGEMSIACVPQAQMNPDIASLSSGHSDRSLPRDIFSLETLPEQTFDSPDSSPNSGGILMRQSVSTRSR